MTDDLQAEFRAQRSLLQAIQDTQQEHTRQLTNVEGGLTNVESRLTNVEDRLGNVAGGLELVRLGIAMIHAKLDLLIDRGSRERAGR